MENASKAILMAGGILIGIIIIGALFLMFKNLTSYQKSGTENTRDAQVYEFNNQFDTYNRNNVRGSELYSLLNRVIDYNRRKTDYNYSSNSKTKNDEGEVLGYMPMQMTVDLKGKQLDFSLDGKTNYLITKESYTESDVDNQFKTNIDDKLKSILGSDYNSDLVQNLGSVASEIYGSLPKSGDNFKKNGFDEYELSSIRDAIIKYNSATGADLKYISSGSESTEDVLKNSLDTLIAPKTIEKAYVCHEFVQFKRAKFNCTEMEADKNTGRIIDMVFEFTGKFE